MDTCLFGLLLASGTLAVLPLLPGAAYGPGQSYAVNYYQLMNPRYRGWSYFQASPCIFTEKFRTIDGSCSNLQSPNWAQAGTPLARMVPPEYYNDQGDIRRAADGGMLPSVRYVSTQLFPDRHIEDSYRTRNFMAWGILLTLDAGQVAERPSGGAAGCCTQDDHMLPEDVPLPPECAPMEVYNNDTFYSTYSVTCLPYVRAQLAPNSFTEQVNSASQTLDVSVLYGSTDEKAASLRLLTGGKLKFQGTPDGRTFLSPAIDPLKSCVKPPSENLCYNAGDPRANLATDLVVYLTLLMRLHNYLCDQLFSLNPTWEDETLYQEARRIVIAIVQHITYKHYLPKLLGNDYMVKKGLTNNDYGCKSFYHSTVNPTTMSEFTGGAYRAFHATVPNTVMFMDENYETTSHLGIDDDILRPYHVQEPTLLDGCLRGMTKQASLAMAQAFPEALSGKLYKFEKPYGSDLLSIDIQRGRDMGLPSYNKIREICGLRKAMDFSEFNDAMSSESISSLSQVYGSPDDVDLLVGGMMEDLLPDSVVGHTLQCIVGTQFYNFMHGDRFYYENCGHPWSFSPDQLKAIYQTSAAWILCLAGDAMKSVPIDVFRTPSEENPITSCESIPTLDLSPWKE